MANTETTFNTEFVDNTIENQPYLNPFAQEALIVWFKANDSIQPVFEDREEWEKREAILENEADVDTGKRVLYLPKDLNLFEMIDVVSVVDSDTYRDNPELSTQGVKKIEALADTFKKAGVYIEENLGSVKDGRDIAEELSKKFFNYGLSLQSRTRQKDEPITPTVLSESDKRELDRWLIGKERYYKVMSRLGPNPSQEDIDSERSRHFEGYFKALSKTGSKGEGDKVWERSLGPIARIQEKARAGIERELNKPARELDSAVFRRGGELLKERMRIPQSTQQMLETVGDVTDRNLVVEHQRLYDYLEIPKLKEELEQVRNTGNIEEISNKEYEIAEKIREEIWYYKYREGAHTPSEVIKDDYLNCLGSTLLGTSLLDEVGIKYLFVTPPRHAMTFLLTSDGKLYWQDFTPEKKDDLRNGLGVTGDVFEGNPDILTLVKEQGSINVLYKLKQQNYNISSSTDVMMTTLMNNLGIHIEEQEAAVELLEKALELHPNSPAIYSTLGGILTDLGRYEEAMEICKRGIEISPHSGGQYGTLGIVLYKLNRFSDAEETLRRGIEVDPNRFWVHYHLGRTLYKLGKLKEASEAYKESLRLEPNNPELHNEYKNLAEEFVSLGRKEDAGEIYNNLGRAFNKLGNFGEAEKILRAGIELSPKNPSLYNTLSHALYGLGRREDAVDILRKGIEISPQDSTLRISLGWLLRSLGRTEEAIEMYTKAIELDPNRPDPYRDLVEIFVRHGQFEKAEKLCIKGLEVNPSDSFLLNRLRTCQSYKQYNAKLL